MDNSAIWKIIDKYFENNPQSLVRHHTESYNDFFKNGIFQIFKEKNPITLSTMYDEKSGEYRHQCKIYMGGKNGDKIYFGKPVIYDDNNAHYMFPNEARLRNMTYGMTIHYDVEIEFTDIIDENEPARLVGIEEIPGAEEIEVEEQEGGEQDGGAKTVKRKKRLAAELTTEQTAAIREMTEQSIKGNMQTRTMVLEKVYLGRFPVMVQSDFCVLHGLPKDARHTMGECKNDIGGYFIIDGKEKTVVPQEKFGDNMLYIKKMNDEHFLYSAEIRSVSENVSKPVRTLSVRIQAPTSKFTQNNIVVNIPNVRKPVPLFIVFRALGVLSDKDIIKTCLLDLDKNEYLMKYLEPSVYDAGNVFSQRSALEYIRLLIKGGKNSSMASVLEIMCDYFLPHIGEMNYQEKAYYLGYIVYKLLLVANGDEKETDRDNYKYKRVELVGSMINDLFREYYHIQQRVIFKGFEYKVSLNRNLYENDLYRLVMENHKNVFNERELEIGFRKAFKGNWGAYTHTKRVGAVQDLNRLSFNTALSHLRKTNLPIDSSAKVVGPRLLNSTQWGFFDPIDTPDGGNIGIHKHLSISSYVTQGYSREPLIDFLKEKIVLKSLTDLTPALISRMTKVFINGYWVGCVSEPIQSVEKVKLFRRNGLIPIYTSISFDVKDNTVYVFTDAGRVCRPIFYKDTETGKMSFESGNFQKKLESGDLNWNQMTTGFNEKADKSFDPNNYKMYSLSELYQGMDEKCEPAKFKRFVENKAVIDYIDTNETENAFIALNAEAYENDKANRFTHMEIHESLIFGMMCNLINYPENNPATRNSFSCGQSKQACSMYHSNHQVRMDKTAVVLNSGQVPLVKSRFLQYINNEENPYGENTIVAIMCYTGYNVEDAILINEGALKRGLFRTTYYTTYETHEEKSKQGDNVTQKKFVNIESEQGVVGTKPGYDYSKLDQYGLINENTPINDKTVLIGSVSVDSENDRLVDNSKTTKKGQLGIVDKTFITDDEEGKRIAKVRIREERIPNIGDKMASRAGQKGTVGLVVPECDMPFTKDGIRPDIIINPHAIPSRMTIGHLVECITGKASCIQGSFTDCTAFNNKGSKVGVFGELLTKMGYHSSGNELLYNGMTGEQIETEIFMGPNYYMRLKHMVKDKINYRALGPRTALTKQPVSGRANDGGLRIGEMERDSVISHGACEFLKESMMERGDKYYLAICNTTGMIAAYNPSKNVFISPMADGPLKFTGSMDGKEMNLQNISKYGRSFSVICVPYSFKLLMQELQVANIQMRLITEDNIEQLENMTFSRNIEKLTNYKNPDIQTTINIINKDIENKINKSVKQPIVTSESSEDSPEYHPAESSESPESIQYQIGTPEFEPMTPDMPPPGSPEFKPMTPDMPPPESSEYHPSDTPDFGPEIKIRGIPIDTPSDDDSSIPVPPMTGSGLAQRADEFQIGESVHYRGDEQPERQWTITYKKEEFMKIETDIPSNGDMDTTQMVTAMDIYKPSDFHTYNPNYVSQQPNLNNQSMPVSNQQGGTTQNFHIAPTYIMNGGTNDMAAQPSVNAVSDQPSNNVSINEPAPGPANVSEDKQEGGGGLLSKALDFGNFIIKKTG